MTTANDPVVDAHRVATLRGLNLLDSPPGESFDRLTRLAARLLKCPVAVVSLVDKDRQFFKSCFGMPEPWNTTREIPLSHSFCKLAVCTDQPVIVPDSHVDCRVQDNPSVVDLGVRAYAGIPIHARTGEVLGSFCVFDGVPREWSDAQIEILTELAASVESEIELVAASQRELQHSHLLNTMIEASPLAVVVIEENMDVCLWNQAAEEMFGWSASEVLGRALPIVPPEKQDECRDIRRRLANGETFQGISTYRCNQRQEPVHVKISAASLEDFDGKSGRTLLIFDDISEQVQMDQEREKLLHKLESEGALREALLEQLPAGAVVAEVPSGRIAFVNKAAADIARGNFPEKLDLKTLAQYTALRPDGSVYEPEEWPLARTILHGEKVSNEEIQVISEDGSKRTMLVSSTPVELGDEPVTTAVTMFTDVTQLKESEAARHRSEEKSRRIIESSQDCIKILDLNGRLLSMSRVGQELFEIDDIAPFVNESWIDLWTGDDRQHAAEAVREACDGNSGRFRGVSPTAKTKTVKWWDVMVTPILDADGRPEQLLCVSRDVTESVTAEKEREALIEQEIKAREAAEVAEEKYRDLVDGLDAIVWEADAETWEFTFVSQRAEEILGYPIDEWLGNSSFWPGIIHPNDRDQTVQICRAACDKCLDHDFEYRAVTRDGRTVWLRDIVYVGSDHDGNPKHLRGVMVDITAKKELETQLRERAEQLSQMDQRKNQFLAILAHELRNPLAPIGNAVDLLLYCADDPEQIGEIRGILQNQVRQMVRLIDDLMDVSRITRGKIKLKREPVLIRDVLETALAAVRPACRDATHKLITGFDEDCSLTVNGDSVRLAQVFTNILNNACKYTPPGGVIEINCSEAAGAVEVSVRDNGIGIPAAEAESIFEMFTQVESSVGKSQGGLGIGLTLVRQLVEMHGGCVSLVDDSSVPGCEFRVRLPLAVSSADQPKQSAEGTIDSECEVLVIDDLPAVATMLGKLITAMGHTATVAFNARDGLKLAEKTRPHIIFSDISMPEMSGYELATQIRSLPHFGDSLLVALTGNGQPEDVRQALDAGFDQHLVKPASAEALQEVFDEWTARQQPDPASAGSASPSATRR